jgi:O-antigen/teichoic acid export membrane protein
LLKKIGSITVADILTKAFGYFLLPVYLGLMPKLEFGEFGFITSALSYMALILGLYLYVPFIRNYSALENDVNKQELVSTIFVSLLIWLITIDILLLALKPLLIEPFAHFFEIRISIDNKFYLTVLLLNSGIAMLYCYSLLIARKSTREIVVFTILKYVVVTIFTLVLIYTDPWDQDSVFNRLLSTAIAELIVMLGYVVFLFGSYLNLSINVTLLRASLRVAIPLIPSALMGLFLAIIDRRLIAQHHGLGELANYNLAMQALAPINMVMSAILMAWAPYLFSIKNNREALAKSVRLMTAGLVIMTLAGALISFAFYLGVALKFISVDYRGVPLLILSASIGVIASALVHLNNNMFVHLGITGIQLANTALLLIVNWALNLILIPNFYSFGAAISAGISNILALALGLLFLYKVINKNTNAA